MQKKKFYIFLTNSLGGISGGPSYVKNKTEWLINNGWTVVAFDHWGANTFEDIKYDTLLQFKNNRLGELFFNPSLFSVTYRNTVLEKISKLSECNRGDSIVIESNTQGLSFWGELLAAHLNAKHLIYLIGENEMLSNGLSEDFFTYKFNRDELFFIDKKSISVFWGKIFDEKQESKYYWSANSIIMPVDINVDFLEQIPHDRVIITFFGRKKPYFNYVYERVLRFAKSIKSMQITFLVIGHGFNSEELLDQSKHQSNLDVLLHAPFFPIPMSLFTKSNVVISNAGCAMISYLSNALTISMDVVTNKPLGVLGYTTTDITYNSTENVDQRDLDELLNDILIKGMYKSDPLFELFSDMSHGYDYQISFVDNDYNYWSKDFVYEKNKNPFIAFCHICIVGKLHMIGLGTWLRRFLNNCRRRL